MNCSALTAIDAGTALLACIGAVTVLKWCRALWRELRTRL
jgi:hypothetical protein